MFETENLTVEMIEQKREKRRNRRRTIKRHRCKACGLPKHYVCLDHLPPQPRRGLGKILQRIKYYSRKAYFNLLKNLKFVE